MTGIDFHCHVCGVECNVAPEPPARAACEEHCEGHQYEYDKWRRGKFCIQCDRQEDEYDYY
jgi:hypothetical protein